MSVRRNTTLSRKRGARMLLTGGRCVPMAVGGPSDRAARLGPTSTGATSDGKRHGSGPGPRHGGRTPALRPKHFPAGRRIPLLLPHAGPRVRTGGSGAGAILANPAGAADVHGGWMPAVGALAL